MNSEIKFDIPAVHDFSGIKKLVQEKTAERKPNAVLVAPSDIDMLKSFLQAAEEKLLTPIIIGDEKLLKANCDKHSLDCSNAHIIDLVEPLMALQTALKMAEAGEVDLIVKGRYHIDEFVETCINPDNNFQTGTISHIGVFKTAEYGKLLLVTDSFVNVEPDLKTKLALITNAVKVAEALTIPEPKTALLAAVEVIYPQMPVTVDAAVISKMSDRRQIKGTVVEGPVSFDIAVDKGAAIAKGMGNSPVAGQADILVAPNIETANGVLKAVSLFTELEIGGILLGGRVPVALSLDYDSAENKYNSLLLGLLLA